MTILTAFSTAFVPVKPIFLRQPRSCGGGCHIVGLAAAVMLLLAGGTVRTVAAAPEVVVSGREISVRTERYAVKLNDLRLVQLENRLTGEVYAAGGAAAPAAADRAGLAGVAIESLRPGLPTRVFGLGERSKVEAKQDGAGALVTYSGLQCGESFDPGLTLTLAVAVDPATGDLLLRPAVKAEIEEVFGARDRGVLHVALQFAGLAEELRLVVPASDGFSVTKDTVPPDWKYQARWPQVWEAALLIAESAKGCLGIWADEPELHYGRTLGIARGGGWNVTLAFETADQIQRCTQITGATWRLNTFAGYWVNAAARYREQCRTQWPDLKPLKDGTPAWADKVRIVITGPTPGPEAARKYVALVPRDSIAVFTCQEWLRGWNEGDILKLKKGMDYFPNWPIDNPTHYEARPDMPAKFNACEELGIHIFPYTNPTVITWGHPWIETKVGPRGFLAYRFWQRLYPELCLDIIKRYGVSGIYEDCSWVVARNLLGEPDGDNWYNGSARMRQYFRQLMPQVATMGERNNEVTWRGQKFALSITQWAEQAHPIVTYLCSPYTRLWNLQLGPGGFDADDVRGWMTPWPTGFEDKPMQERLVLRQRGLVFAKEQLASYWPERWDPAVMHYFKSAKGEEFRFVRDRGTRFVKLTPAGAETLYWRLKGVTEADIGACGVEGWLAYDGTRAMGLNPGVVYPVFEGIKRCPVTLASVPAGCHVSQSVVRDGFWVVALAANDPKAAGAPREVTVRVHAVGVQLKGVSGATPAGPLTAADLDLKVKVPGGFGVYWGEPAVLGDADPLTRYPVQNSIHRRDSGLITQAPADAGGGDEIGQACGSTDAGEEGTMPWLVTIPAFSADGDDQLYLQFLYGSMHPFGDGANYAVRVNGRTVWKRYRPEQGKPDPKDPSVATSIPLSRGQVNLQPYAGQTVVLELVSDGNLTGVSEKIIWHRPRLSAKPDNQAETDDGDRKAPGPAAELDLTR